MEVATLILARIDSSRLPRKHLLEINGRPIITYLIERLQLSKESRHIVLCTTPLPEDDVLVSVAESVGISVFRGHPTDLLVRWLQAAEAFGIDFMVSAEGDDVLCDPEYVDKIVQVFRETRADYITCRGLPFGVTPDGIKVDALRKVCAMKGESSEGQKRYFTDTGLFHLEYIDVVDPALNAPGLRMSLDYKEDFEFFKSIFEAVGSTASLKTIIEYLIMHPEVVAINKDCQERCENHAGRSHGEIHLLQE